jgi:hypothetical protein
MLRRALLAILAAKVMPALIPENAFALAYNEWIRLRIEAPDGTVSAHVMRQWPHVKKAWQDLERSIQ